MNGKDTKMSNTPGAYNNNNITQNALRKMTPGAAINALLNQKNKTHHGSSGLYGTGASNGPHGGLNGVIQESELAHENGSNINGSAGSISSDDSSASSALRSSVSNPSALLNGTSKKASTSGAVGRHENPDGSYRRDGIVQPAFRPIPSQVLKNTNQLEYIRTVVMKAVTKHQLAWPFVSPVDSVKLRIPDYHDVIKQPMDLNTIKLRLDNHYYHSVHACIEDFKIMFTNCYTYNQPTEDVVKMAQEVEKCFLTNLAKMPSDEIELPVKAIKGTKPAKRGPGRPVGSSKKAPVVAVNKPKQTVPSKPKPVSAPAASVTAPPPVTTQMVLMPGAVPLMQVPPAGMGGLFSTATFPFPGVQMPPPKILKVEKPMTTSPIRNAGPRGPAGGPKVSPAAAHAPATVSKASKVTDIKKNKRRQETGLKIAQFEKELALVQEKVDKIKAAESPPVVTPKAGRGRKRKTVDMDERASESPSKGSILASLMDDKKSNSPKKKSPKRQISEIEAPVVAPSAKKPRKPRTPKPKPAPIETISPKRASPVAAAPTGNKSAVSAGRSPAAASVSPKRKTPPPPQQQQQQPAPTPAQIIAKRIPFPLPKVVNPRIMSFDEKQRLSERINTLQGDQLERVVQIIQAMEPQYADAPEEIEIDFETLKPDTLCTLEIFVDQALEPQAPPVQTKPADVPPTVPHQTRPTQTLKNAQSWESFAKSAQQQSQSAPLAFQSSFEEYKKQAKEKTELANQLKQQEMQRKKEREREQRERETLARREREREMEMQQHQPGHHRGYDRGHPHGHAVVNPHHPPHMFMPPNVPSPSGFGYQQSPSSSLSPASMPVSPASGVAASPPDAFGASIPPMTEAERKQAERNRMREEARRHRAQMAGRIDLNHQHDVIASFESQMQS